MFLEHGYNLYKPILENGKIDLIAEKNGNFIRIQIKTVSHAGNQKIIPLRKISHNMGEYKVKRYTKEDIDYFIGVDLESYNIYILPVEFSSKYRHSISISNCDRYKNNFEQLEPIIGNINSGQDDNVEPLTDKADGNDVGMNLFSAANE